MTKHGAEIMEAMLTWYSKPMSTPSLGLPLFAVEPFLVTLAFLVIPQDVAMNQLWWGTSFPRSGLGLTPGNPLWNPLLGSEGSKEFDFYLCLDRLGEISRHFTQSARALTQCLALISRSYFCSFIRENDVTYLDFRRLIMCAAFV